MEKKAVAIRVTFTAKQYEWLVEKGFMESKFNKAGFILNALVMAHDDFPDEEISRGGTRSSTWMVLRRKNYELITRVMAKRGRWKEKVVLEGDTDERRRKKDWLIMGEYDSKEHAEKVAKAYVQRQERLKGK